MDIYGISWNSMGGQFGERRFARFMHIKNKKMINSYNFAFALVLSHSRLARRLDGRLFSLVENGRKVRASQKRRCRVTPGGREPTESAAESRPPERACTMR